MLQFDGKNYSEEYVKAAIRVAEQAEIPEGSRVEGNTAPLRLACETPCGLLLAYTVYEGYEYPGIAIDLVEKETREEVGLVTTEVNTTAGNTLTTYGSPT